MNIAIAAATAAGLALATAAGLVPSWPALAAIKGKESRQPLEDFGKDKNRHAQLLVNRKDLAEETSGIVTVDCYRGVGGKNYRDEANGVLVCDQQTVLISAHQLKTVMCIPSPDYTPFCVIRGDRHNPDFEYFDEQDPYAILPDEVCSSSYDKPDLAILKLQVPSERKPVKIGVAEGYHHLHRRRFVNVATNITSNYRGPDGQPVETERTFTTGRFDEKYSSHEAKTSLDIDRGSSGSAVLVDQDGSLALIASVSSMAGETDGNGSLVNGLPYDLYRNYSLITYFNDMVAEFFERHIEDFDACRIPITRQGAF